MNFIFSFQEQDTLFSDSFIFLNKENIYSSMNLCKDYGKVFLYTTDSFYKKIKNSFLYFFNLLDISLPDSNEYPIIFLFFKAFSKS